MCYVLDNAVQRREYRRLGVATDPALTPGTERAALVYQGFRLECTTPGRYVFHLVMLATTATHTQSVAQARVRSVLTDRDRRR